MKSYYITTALVKDTLVTETSAIQVKALKAKTANNIGAPLIM